MSEKWIGIVASPGSISVVGLEYDAFTDEKPIIFLDEIIRVDDADKPLAYRTVYQRILDLVKENKPNFIAVKGSATTGTVSAGLMNGAEVRGVVIASVATMGVRVVVNSPAAVAQHFGDRTLDEYIGDESFWTGAVNGTLRNKISKGAAINIIYAKEHIQ